ncbi:hypothetical protein GALMADRAFT_146596 [Galerina marginata CBS 339.88]|uniref:Uncharacterized protein n=1 Tax=Galerina marginata (strain CBS 339.88) TaxID=685588 RepID=A0A067SB05_GALM3|nr:hypothetical protein GALMADRAFT_146596 [Galerina marginata CBS 339.88]
MKFNPFFVALCFIGVSSVSSIPIGEVSLNTVSRRGGVGEPGPGVGPHPIFDRSPVAPPGGSPTGIPGGPGRLPRAGRAVNEVMPL